MNDFCVLFDMDGVLVDTEAQYDAFFGRINDEYSMGIPDLAQQIKGTTLADILTRFFSRFSDEDREAVRKRCIEFETKMDFPDIQGAPEIIKSLKKHNVKIGLITSSMDSKMEAVYRQKHFDELFDTIVTANRIAKGKPDPECYLLGAKDLGFDPTHCIVFEDALSGIEAARSAGMIVVGLSTTNPAAILREKVDRLIPDFTNFTYADVSAIYTTFNPHNKTKRNHCL